MRRLFELTDAQLTTLRDAAVIAFANCRRAHGTDDPTTRHFAALSKRADDELAFRRELRESIDPSLQVTP